MCKDDLVCIPPKLARQMANISPLTVCTRIGNTVHLLDPSTLQHVEVTPTVYWRAPFDSLASVSELKEFVVLDVEPARSQGRFVLADAQVALTGAFRSQTKEDDGMDYDDGTANQIFHTRTHLGAILQPGDTAMGYFLTTANYNSTDFASLPESRVPDVVLVKKAYPNRRKKTKARNWQLKSIAKEVGGDEGAEEGTVQKRGPAGVIGRMGGRDQKKVDADYELFLRDLEEDAELRGTVNLYKADARMAPPEAGTGERKPKKGGQYGMDVDDTPAAPSGADDDDDEEDEPDFPEVKLDELLEGFDEMTLEEDQ